MWMKLHTRDLLPLSARDLRPRREVPRRASCPRTQPYLVDGRGTPDPDPMNLVNWCF